MYEVGPDEHKMRFTSDIFRHGFNPENDVRTFVAWGQRWFDKTQLNSRPVLSHSFCTFKSHMHFHILNMFNVSRNYSAWIYNRAAGAYLQPSQHIRHINLLNQGPSLFFCWKVFTNTCQVFFCTWHSLSRRFSFAQTSQGSTLKSIQCLTLLHVLNCTSSARSVFSSFQLRSLLALQLIKMRTLWKL